MKIKTQTLADCLLSELIGQVGGEDDEDNVLNYLPRQARLGTGESGLSPFIQVIRTGMQTSILIDGEGEVKVRVASRNIVPYSGEINPAVTAAFKKVFVFRQKIAKNMKKVDDLREKAEQLLKQHHPEVFEKLAQVQRSDDGKILTFLVFEETDKECDPPPDELQRIMVAMKILSGNGQLLPAEVIQAMED